ncbi:MAG: hypothetical protein AAGF12_20600 [Myxococcota bacterium]
MNFFGHVVISLESGPAPDDPLFVFGSMLPDFASMTRVRIRPPLAPAAVDAGVRFHHQTDAVFHRAKTFVEAERSAFNELRPKVGRGAALAIAHVGTEMLLDGHLVESAPAVAAYLDALAAAEAQAAFGLGEAGDSAVGKLVGRLRGYGAPTAYADPDWVAERLFDILRPRRRLAIPPERADDVHSWTRKMQRDLAPHVGTLMDEVRTGIGDAL